MPEQFPHLEPVTVAAYVERRLSGDDLANAERHLADCAACRREVAQVVAVLRPTPRRWVPIVSLAAAAVVVAAILQLWPGSESAVPVVRDSGITGAIRVVAPDTLIDPVGSTSFVWNAVVPAARYEFTLADEAGSRIFSAGTSDTAVVLPDSVQLQRGRTYQWFVDALRPDGRSTTSGVRFVRIAP